MPVGKSKWLNLNNCLQVLKHAVQLDQVLRSNYTSDFAVS